MVWHVFLFDIAELARIQSVKQGKNSCDSLALKLRIYYTVYNRNCVLLTVM